MGNEAQNLMASMGYQPKEQRIAEMAGAVTRLIINDTIKEAKKRAQVRDSNTQPQKVEKHSQNG